MRVEDGRSAPALAVFLAISMSIAISVPLTAASEETFVVLDGAEPASPPEVAFLAAPPAIDGVLDEPLDALPVGRFSYLLRSAADDATHEPSYRLAYGTSFFYLFLTLAADEVVVRDRAYQNGDGFVLVLAPGVPTREGAEEFYMLGFAPAGGPFGSWKFTWSYNGGWPFLPMGDDVLFETRHADGRLSFELLLPWEYVYPHHPWFTDPLELNLLLTKASGETDAFTYLVAADVENESVDFSSRMPLRFAEPALTRGAQTWAILERNHVDEGEPLRLRTRTLSVEPGADRLYLGLLTGEKAPLDRQLVELGFEAGLSENDFEIPLPDAPPGAYRLLWRTMRHGSMGEADVSVLPAFDAASIAETLSASPATVSAGSRTTLLFELEQILAEADRLLPYDTAGELRLKMARFERRLAGASEGEDPLAGKTGYVRRAFRSEVDGTLQPYTVRVPADYDAERTYPAIVFLHGSDVDDTAVRRHTYLERDGFFIIAPKGRNPQGAYILENAQEDIEEAIRDALASYAIDPERLVLAGFSMGGYGAYRTFYEHPERYRGVAVFSGDPDVGNRYLDSGSHPNFLLEEYLEPFRGARVAVFHGRGDRNCPFELTDEVVGKLEAAGAEVVYYVDEDVGHSPPRDPEILQAFQDWLEATAAAPEP